MANILFFVLHEVGSLNASFRLAHDLEQRGHVVTYAGVPDSGEIVTVNGFAFIPLFEAFFPKGSVDALTDDPSGWRYPLFLLRKHVMLSRFVDALVDGADGEVFAAFDRLAPDIILLSGGRYAEWPALMARARSIRAVYLGSTLVPRRGSGLPPMSSSIIPWPGGSLWQSLAIRTAWAKHDLTLGIHFLGHDALTRRLADKYGIRAYERADALPAEIRVSLPEIIPFPRCFDFPGFAPPDQYFIEASIMTERVECDFAWDRLREECPIAYCALGTYKWRPRRAYVRFFRCVLDVAAATPSWDWVIALGGTANVSELGDIPGNAIIVDRAPQLALLRRSRVMVGHSGANSVKEAVFFGVPSVLFPLGADQAGMAARAVYHGVGVRGDFDGVRGRDLRLLFEEAIGSGYIGSQVAAMRRRFAEGSGSGVGAVERLMPRGPCGAAEVGIGLELRDWIGVASGCGDRI